MRKILLSIQIILLTVFNSFAQWSTDPNNNLIVGYGLNPNICSDSVGGCYITYEYGTTGYPRKLGLEKLDKYGYKPWGILKQIFGELEEQWLAEIVEDGEGGIIISYLDDTIVGTNFTYRVRVQRVDSAGNFLWGTTGVRVNTTEINHGDQAIVSDGNGGCIVVWPNQLPNFTYEFRANRITNLGERAWSDTGIYLENNIDSDPAQIVKASDENYYIQIRGNLYRINQNGAIIRQDSVTLGYPVTDSEGGVVLSGRVGSINNRRLVAQRQDSLGNNLWQEPYVEIAESLGLGSFRIGVNENIINYAWLGTYNRRTDRPFFQAINLDGNLLHKSKILLSEDSSGTTLIGIVVSFNHNTIFSWSIAPNIDAIFAQMYDTLGEKLWNENGVIVAHPRMTNQQYTIDTRGGFIMSGLINNFTVVAQQVSKNGNLGEIITHIVSSDNQLLTYELTLNQNYPNPFNSSSIIEYSVPLDENIVIEIFNTLGERVKTIVKKFQNKGTYRVEISSDELTSGIYLYRLKTEKKSLTKKLIIIK